MFLFYFLRQTTFQYLIIFKHLYGYIAWHKQIHLGTLKMVLFVYYHLYLFIPNITFKHTQFQEKSNFQRILWGVDSYGYVTPCIGNMSSHLHRYMSSIKVIELFEWQQLHHHLQNIFWITITLRRWQKIFIYYQERIHLFLNVIAITLTQPNIWHMDAYYHIL